MSLPYFLENEGSPASRNSRDVGLFFTSPSTYKNLPLSSPGNSSQNPGPPCLKPRHHREPFLGKERTGGKNRILRAPVNTGQFAGCKIACYPFFAFLVLSEFLARVETSRSAVPL